MSRIIRSLALSAAAALTFAAASGPAMAEDTRLSTIFTAPSRAAPTLHTAGTPTYAYRPAPPSLLAPGSGPPARARYYYYQPAAPDPDGAPCPTRSRDSLGELFACTMR